LVPIYIIQISFNHLLIKPVEMLLFALFFVLAVVMSAIFYDYSEKIRPFFDNMVQFAALRDSKKFIEDLELTESGIEISIIILNSLASYFICVY
ncbi:MAG: hypothetical protein WCP66_09315, partial [Methylococcales bacterium]